tara:strand:+ start:1594 stop:1908 length:315 start_codon:yes stop_codon:yes gene_type:complete
MKLFGREWFSIGPDEAAIVLGQTKVNFHWPMPEAAPKQELMDTLAFLQHAISRQDWWEEWAMHEEYLAQIARGPEETKAPKFDLIEGGKSNIVSSSITPQHSKN